jgi:catalase
MRVIKMWLEEKIKPSRMPLVGFRFATATALAVLILAEAAFAGEVDTGQLVAEMNQRIATITRSSQENGVIPRFNQAKSLGCFDATFRVHEEIDSELKQGLFATPATYPARLRFANASEQDDSKKDIRGLSIKVMDVQGQSIWGESGTQDFLLNSYPALFVATPEEFLEFIKARQEDKIKWFFFNPLSSHLKSVWILFKARVAHASPFNIRFWSTTPFKHGTDDSAVKYSVTPCTNNPAPQVPEPGKNQLRSAMKAHLAEAPVCLEFGVQKRTEPESMPIENASVIWDENVSPFITVATITINQQDFDSTEAMAACEKISFNPWQSLPEHQPLGRMNEVRKETYFKAFQLRTAELP